MRWRDFFNNKKKSTEDDRQGLQQVKSLIQFGDDLVRIVKKRKFRKVKNDFQKMLREEM